jgi:hypothetical protein
MIKGDNQAIVLFLTPFAMSSHHHQCCETFVVVVVVKLVASVSTVVVLTEPVLVLPKIIHEVSISALLQIYIKL